MNNTTIITEKMMLDYLQSYLDFAMNEKERFGMDERTEGLFHGVIACKEMVEALIKAPVNLQKDGKVTVGF